MSVTVTDLDWQATMEWLRDMTVHQADKMIGYDAVSQMVEAYRRDALAADTPLSLPEDGDQL